MSKYRIVYTEKAESDLHNIFEYVAYKLIEPQIAKKLVKSIIEKIAKLDDLPMRHAIYEKEPWKSKGLRVLPIDNYLAFYLPVEEEKTVKIIRIMYGGRSVEKQLDDHS